METRELAYFVAVAEELHVGRAAQRLGMAQPPLSRAIQRLERRLGVLLFERTSRGVTLTPAGAVLLEEGRRALDAVDAAARRAVRAGQPTPRLTLVMKPDGDAGLLEHVLPLYRRDPDAVEVEVLVSGIGEQAQLLRDGRADVALLPAHDDLTGFDTEVLLVLDQVAVLPRGHRLAGREALVLADLAGEPQLHDEGSPQVRDVGQLMQLVALGQLVAVVPETARRNGRSDVVTVPVLDAPTTSLVLAWPEGSRSRAVAAFVRASTRAATADQSPARAAVTT
ncbi:LysR family transcriptional regulator [uncultured Modestobacter sp.]|uniref:LysR family transcriptional regulator n=1 Tax=uncultured Modestobacter sp. TaxID=380048 RepID=UPI00260BED74|nr:LysR family transcriptional regulator [uncultured Modestobacter sp.]